MKPRSIILDLFGDYLRYAGNQVKAGDLVTLLGDFGVEPATVRMTLSRLRRDGWFTSRRAGRETVYSLTAHMISVLDEGRTRIFADYEEPWDGNWTTIIYQSGLERLTRDQVRKRLAWLGFGPLSTSTWITPRERMAAAAALEAEFPDLDTTLMRSTTGRLDEDRRLAERCWDLPRINELYREFVSTNEHLVPRMGTLSGADALITRTSVIASYRHFPFLDPWLPAELRPEDWLGSVANSLFRDTHDGLGPAADGYVASVIGGFTRTS